MLSFPAAIFAEGPPMITEGAAWIGVLGTVITTCIIRAEALAKLLSDIRMSWFKATSDQDSVVIKQLEGHIARLDKEHAELKASNTDMRSEMTVMQHEQAECHLREERLWGYVVLLHDYGARQAAKLEEQGLTVEPPPPMPERQASTQSALDTFHARTKANNIRLAKEVAIVAPVIVPPPVPAEGKP